MSENQIEIYRNSHRELIQRLQEIQKLAFTLSLISQPKPGHEKAWADAVEKLEGRDL
jgi:hypothetical protein